jgi:hypothetical protein
MKKFEVTYSLLAQGYLEVEALDEESTEQVVFEMPLVELIRNAEFDGGLYIEEIVTK